MFNLDELFVLVIWKFILDDGLDLFFKLEVLLFLSEIDFVCVVYVIDLDVIYLVCKYVLVDLVM